MAQADAIKFINKIKTSNTLRTSLYGCDSPLDIDNLLKSLGYNFTYEESEDAYRNILLNARDTEEAWRTTEVFNMYRMLIGMTPLSFNH